MKKILLFSGVIGLAIILAGCGQKNQNTDQGNQTQTQESQKTDQTKNDSVTSKVINSAEAVKNAISGGQKLECVYKMKGIENMGEIKGYIDGKKYKSSFDMNGEKYTSIMDGETIYNWSEKTKQGTKMNIQCIEDLNKDLPQSDTQGKYESPEDMADSMMDVNCQPASSVDFSIPSDIVFTDTCQQMKDSMQNLKEFQIPANVNL